MGFVRRQSGVRALLITDRGLTVKENDLAILAEASKVFGRSHVLALASRNLADHPSPSATVAHSGALLLKNADVHVSSLSTPRTGSLGR